MKRGSRFSLQLSGLLVFVLTLCVCSVQPVQAADAKSLSELLDLFAMSSEFFGQFVDDQPLSDEQQQSVYKLLFRLRDLPPADVQDWAQGVDALDALPSQSKSQRGKLFYVTGNVTRVKPIELTTEQKARFQFTALFRCDFVATNGLRLEVLAREVPSAWQRDEPIDERASFRGMFVKRLAAGGPQDAGPLLFVTMRVAWQPATLLGKLGMDAGLFDDVRDRAAIGGGDRESFYQLLSAVEQSQPGVLEREANEQLARRRRELPSRIEKFASDPLQQAELKRELARSEQNVDDVVSLFNDAAAQRGKLFVLEGDAQRIIEIQVDDSDIERRFGIRHYYEIELITADSQGNPIVFCVASLPPGMPQGEEIREHVRIAGFFLKTYAFSTKGAGVAVEVGGKAQLRQQLAPLLIGRQPIWIPSDHGPRTFSGVILALLSGALLLVIAWTWRQRRGDRRFYRQACGEQNAAPDFSKLD